MSSRRSLRPRTARANSPSMDANVETRATTRLARAATSLPSVTVSRSSSSASEGAKRSIRLTVKMPSSKLREVTNGNSRGASRRSVNVFTEDPIVTGPRTSRPRKRLMETSTSDEEDGDNQENEEDNEDAADEDEDLDADGDMDMDDAPPQPPPSRRQARIAAAAPAGKSLKGVEDKELELEDDDEEDEELSELDSDAEGEPEDQDESGIGNANEELDEEDDLDIDSEDGTPAGDPAKLTKRQRGNLGNDFLQLPMEPQVKKHLTAEERAMRRAEMARRRKNLSEKRNEEEKMDTINRLLRKQAPKRRGRIPVGEAEATAAEQETQEFEKPDPTMVRWVSGREGSKISIPEDWIDTPAGRVFGNGPVVGTGPRKLVEEV